MSSAKSSAPSPTAASRSRCRCRSRSARRRPAPSRAVRRQRPLGRSGGAADGGPRRAGGTDRRRRASRPAAVDTDGHARADQGRADRRARTAVPTISAGRAAIVTLEPATNDPNATPDSAARTAKRRPNPSAPLRRTPRPPTTAETKPVAPRRPRPRRNPDDQQQRSFFGFGGGGGGWFR